MSHARVPHALTVALAGSAALAVLITALLALAPTGAAQDQQPGFGEIVGDVSDTEHVVATDGPSDVRFRDSDGDSALDGGEAVYLADGSSVASGDVRLANPSTSNAFSKVSSGDSDVGLDTDSLSGTVRYFDADSSSALSSGDTVYYDLTGSGENKASSRDVVLAGDDAGTLVSGSHDQISFGLADISGSPVFGYYDANDDGDFDTGEAALIDVDDDDYVTVGDVRLGSTSGGSGGSIAVLGDDDVTYVLEDFSDTWAFHHRDPDDDETYDSIEPVYLSTSGQVATFATRIANVPDGHVAGSQVIESHSDWGITTFEVSGSLSYLDEDNDGDFTDADTLYYDASTTTSGEVARGDIILSGEEAGQIAGGGTGSTGESLESYSGSLRYLDADANGAYGGGGDTVYADTDDDGIVDADAVQLSDGEDPFQADAEPPSIILDTPADGANVTVGEDVSIEGTASAGDADLDTVEVDVDGDALDVTGLESFNATWTAEGIGEHTVNATVTDADGMTGTASVSITVEAEPAEPPTIELDAPTANDTLIAGQAVEINGTATPGEANLSSVEVTAAGSSLEVTGLESFNATWTPEDPGTYLVQATVTDENDLTATASVEATVEQPDPPTIEITEPAEMAQATVGELVNVTGSASAGSAALDTVDVTANGSSLDVAGTGAWQATWVPEGAGVQTVNATVTDEAGLAASDEVRVNVTAADEDDEEGVPGPGPLVVVSTVAGLALAARRTRA